MFSGFAPVAIRAHRIARYSGAFSVFSSSASNSGFTSASFHEPLNTFSPAADHSTTSARPFSSAGGTTTHNSFAFRHAGTVAVCFMSVALRDCTCSSVPSASVSTDTVHL